MRTLLTTRTGGVSVAPYASLNLGDHVGDDPRAVAENRQRLAARLPASPCWLQQVHGTTVVTWRLLVQTRSPWPMRRFHDFPAPSVR